MLFKCRELAPSSEARVMLYAFPLSLQFSALHCLAKTLFGAVPWFRPLRFTDLLSILTGLAARFIVGPCESLSLSPIQNEAYRLAGQAFVGWWVIGLSEDGFIWSSNATQRSFRKWLKLEVELPVYLLPHAPAPLMDKTIRTYGRRLSRFPPTVSTSRRRRSKKHRPLLSLSLSLPRPLCVSDSLSLRLRLTTWGARAGASALLRPIAVGSVVWLRVFVGAPSCWAGGGGGEGE